MPKLKVLSAEDIIHILSLFGFLTISQRGSHIKLRRVGKTGEKQILTIPFHKELDKGTVRAIYRQASRFILEEELYEHFYTRE